MKPQFQSSRSPLRPVRPSGEVTMNPSSRSGRGGGENIHPNIHPSPSPSLLKKAPSPSRHSDPDVKVVVRMRPGDSNSDSDPVVAHKLSSNSLSVAGRTFSFNSVLGPDATQDHVFNMVGAPLVRDSLAGFNASIVSYGQSGSGKTYTIWGPPSAMLDGASSLNSSLGIVPRIFHMLFSEINREREGSGEQRINYQCRCSFLEVYNNQINDLLDPTQRNLQIRDDTNNGLHVESLSDEYVTTVEDVTQLLVKGLSSRKVGTTSVNSKSSRSHILFTCVIESWNKGTSSRCFGSSKTSRISFFDLAGSDTYKSDDIGSHCVKDERHVKKSLSKLGKLVNILAEAKQFGDGQKMPHDSCLTHLLQETLGGNAKVTFICTIFPNDRHKAGSLSTLRFGERAIHIQNKAVVNEITEDDVNGLSDQIRQLKEELIRAKSLGGPSVGNIGGNFRGRSARDSLNLLRVSLNRSLILHPVDNDSEEEMDVDEDDVKELCTQLANVDPSSEDSLGNILENEDSACLLPSKESTRVNQERSGQREFYSETSGRNSYASPSCSDNNEHFNKSDLSLIPLPLADDPTLCESPKISTKWRKSLLSLQGGDEYPSDSQCFAKRDLIRSSLQSSKVFPTESLAASLHRGLQIIDFHQRVSPVNRSYIGLSFEHLTSITRQSVNNVDAGIETSPKDVAFSSSSSSSSFICSSCRKVYDGREKPGGENSEMQIVQAIEAGTPEIPKKQMFKADGMISADNIRKEMDLTASCVQQSSGVSALKELNKDQGSSQADEYAKQNHFDICEREALVEEIQSLRDQLKAYTDASAEEASPLEMVRNGNSVDKKEEDIDMERQRWTESESRWISLAEDLRLDLESNRRVAEKKEMELEMEKKCTAELDDALKRSILGHARIIEHYVELQEKHESLVWSHRKVMEGIAEVKKAAAKAGGKRAGSAFVSALAAELSTLRIDREKERAYLKEENKGLRVQLRDTAEAVHAAGELLVRLREAEEVASVTEEKYEESEREKERLRKQLEKMKRKHAMEMVTMKQCIAESRLPESALEPFYLNVEEDSKVSLPEEEQSWRSAFKPSYQ